LPAWEALSLELREAFTSNIIEDAATASSTSLRAR
jgi:hypothetical protein